MSENKRTPDPWKSITSPGQVKPGDKLRFTIGDDPYIETAKEILFKGTEREEIIYNKKRNYYLITSMCMANQGSQKNVKFLSVETIESAKKQRDELLEAAKLLLSRKRPGAKEDDPRLILEIDCLNLEDAIARVKANHAS